MQDHIDIIYLGRILIVKQGNRLHDMLEHGQKVSVSQKLLWRKLQILVSLYIPINIEIYLFSSHLSPSLSSLSLYLLVKEMASSKLMAFIAMLVVLLPMLALGSNDTSPLDGFLGTYFQYPLLCTVTHMNILHRNTLWS